MAIGRIAIVPWFTAEEGKNHTAIANMIPQRLMNLRTGYNKKTLLPTILRNHTWKSQDHYPK